MGLPGWYETARRLRELGATASAAECQGTLSGLLAAAHGDPRSAWLAETIGFEEPDDVLDRLYEQTRAQLDDEAFGFELMLPPDAVDLATRTAALAEWAGGFVFGVACAGRHPGDLPADSAEFLRDVAEIARLEAGEDSGDEADYAEVVEYLRAGAMLTRTECVAGSR